ncbi:MAG: glutamyl-tRNA reductase [Eggerthellaceae bacterium]|nr:glutamyl-tRNA reductase [Eggerthellaceae bacterium]
MSLIVMGVNYKSADIQIREKAKIAPEELTDVLHDLCSMAGIMEAVALSTCNRTEVYVRSSSDRLGIDACTALFVERMGVDYRRENFYIHRNERAIRWIMQVAASLDSQVLGEGQIMAQVKEAYEGAVAAGTCGEVLTRLMKDALHAGKLVRSETRIGAGAVSLSTAALDTVRESVPDLTGAKVVLVGAGEMAALAAGYLAEDGVEFLTVTSRSFDHAQTLAGRFACAKAVPFEERHRLAAEADVVFVAVGAPEPVICADALAAARGEGTAPLLIVDVSMPRAVEAACGEIPGVTVRDLDSLNGRIDANLQTRHESIARARGIVDSCVEEHLMWLQARTVQPTIKELYARANDIARTEAHRTCKAIAREWGRDLTPEETGAVDMLASSIVKKLLYGPTTRLRTETQSGDSHYLTSATRFLFGLDTHPVSTSNDILTEEDGR